MMPDTVLDGEKLKLLSLLQSGFPLSREPYADLALKLGTSSERVISSINELKAGGIVRQISPVLDARKLGYRNTLVALKVQETNLARAESYVFKHPGISHAYEREHEFNIWVTFSIHLGEDMQEALIHLASKSGASAIIDLPAIKIFKLRTNFGADSEEQDVNSNLPAPVERQREVLSDMDRRIINGLQRDLPLKADPFNELAQSLHMDTDEFLRHCRTLLRRGIIRRYGASVNHFKAGYRANAMTCWSVPADQVDCTGRKMASLRQVSHCYERKTGPAWRYNVFTMIHGQSRETCEKIIEKIRAETGLSDYAVLFSTREFKKTRIKYLV